MPTQWPVQQHESLGLVIRTRDKEAAGAGFSEEAQDGADSIAEFIRLTNKESIDPTGQLDNLFVFRHASQLGVIYVWSEYNVAGYLHDSCLPVEPGRNSSMF